MNMFPKSFATKILNTPNENRTRSNVLKQSQINIKANSRPLCLFSVCDHTLST